MTLRQRLPFWLPLCGLIALGLAGVTAVPGPAAENPRDQQVADLEKQIADMSKKLEEMRKQLDEFKKNGKATTQTGGLPAGTLPAEWVKALAWRCIGPAAMGGRIVGLSVFEADPNTYWVATASGGLLKTVNNGVTFEHQFDHEATVSIGAVCVAPSNRDIVWVGTGENNPRNSVSYGDGVYKSTDGGKTWKQMGLNKTYQVGSIVVHPKNPDIVYVGALGRLYGANEDRGLYKTTDGGKSWQKVHYVDDKTGVIDIHMSPADPETLLVAMWERKRDGFDQHSGEPPMPEGYDGYDPIVKWGKGGGIYKTTDGGKSFKKLTKGLPSSPTGRIGLDWYLKDPKVCFAIIDCQDIGKGPDVYLGIQGADAEGGMRLTSVTPGSPAAEAGLQPGDLVKEADKQAVKGWDSFGDLLYAHKSGEKMTLQVMRKDAKESKEMIVTLGKRPDTTPSVYPGFFGQETDQGLRVFQVADESPAAVAGMKQNDIVKAIEKQPIKSMQELTEQMRGRKAGDKVTFTVLRDKETKEIQVALAERPGGRGGFGGGGGGGGGGRASSVRPFGAMYGGQRENVQREQGPGGTEFGGIYKSTDAGDSWVRINSLNPRPMYFSLVRVDPSDDKYLYVGGVAMYKSKDGGKTFAAEANRGRGVHDDRHSLWINPKDGRHMIVGCDGGFYVTYDRMDNWDFLNTTAIGQFYHVAVDNRMPYHVYGGMQDNGSWGGPSRTLSQGGPLNEDWIMVNGGDGFVCRVDPTDSDVVYAESQDGNIVRRNLRTGEQANITPRARGGRGGPGGPAGGAPGETAPAGGAAPGGAAPGGAAPAGAAPGGAAPAGGAAQAGQPGRGQGGGRGGRGGQGGQGGGRGANAHRFNWNTPFILSSHNPKIIYAGGEVVFRSVSQGDDWKIISPEITKTKRGSATALSESPRNPDVLWVGTDDGALWVTRDGGAKWDNVADKVGLPGPRWVATLEASRYAEGRCYVCFDGHRSDDDEPYVYATEDYGQTWKSVRANLPTGSSRVLREDIRNSNLLFTGTEFGAWASVNRGASWTKINNNLPTVAVHEFAIHPTAGEMVIATHGRSLWVLDISALRQMSEQTVKAPVQLYEPNTVIRWRFEPTRGAAMGSGARYFFGQNPQPGAHIYFSLNEKAKKADIKILDYAGKSIREISAPTDPGLHRVTWDMAPAGGRGGGRGGFGGGGGGGGRGGQAGGTPPAGQPGESAELPPQRQRAFSRFAAPGNYRVVLTVDGKEFTQTVRVENDPTLPNAIMAEQPDPLDDAEERERREEKEQAQKVIRPDRQ